MSIKGTLPIAALLVCTAGVAWGQEASVPPPPPGKSPVCSNYRQVLSSATFPREALDQNLESGRVVVEFTLTADDRVTNVRTFSTTHPAFAAASERLVAKLECKSWGREVVIKVPFEYRVAD